MRSIAPQLLDAHVAPAAPSMPFVLQRSDHQKQPPAKIAVFGSAAAAPPTSAAATPAAEIIARLSLLQTSGACGPIRGNASPATPP
jgi:hypothetical protein